MAVILVTGSAGQLGNELKVSSKNYPGYEFVFMDIDSLDITNKEAVDEAIKKTDPDWIINCVAYNFVDKAETNPDGAFSVNSAGPKNIADAVRGTDCRFIHISTDYVFDGTSTTPYNEISETNPRSVYGRSKLEGEKNALSHNNTMVIRTAWLYSSFGNNFVKTILKHAREKESLKVVFDQTGTPTYAADLADSILSVISKIIRNQSVFTAGIYHFTNEGVCSWYDFATEIVSEAGLNCKINPIMSVEYPTAAARPAYSVLDKSKIKETYGIYIPHWRASLRKCMKLMQ
jgi:dTDP-4-dehydrorhamnose reductase